MCLSFVPVAAINHFQTDKLLLEKQEVSCFADGIIYVKHKHITGDNCNNPPHLLAECSRSRVELTQAAPFCCPGNQC